MYTLIVNLSLRSVRVIVFGENGKKVHEDWLPVRTIINGQTVEQDPNEWWRLLLELMRKAFAIKKFSQSIGYISVTSSSLCLVALGKKGNVLKNSLMVSDKRAAEESAELKDKFKDSFEARSKIKFDPSFMLPKILWIKNNEPKILKKAYKFLSSNDFLVYKLTGKFITDDLNAEKFYYDIAKKAYPNSLLQFVGISPSQLPKVVKPGTTLIGMNPRLKRDLGIIHSIKIAIGTYDAICALIGSSTYKEGELNNVCGTCSSYRLFLNKLPDRKENNLIIQKLSSENLYMVGGSNNLEGGLLEWAKECFYGDSYLKDDNFLYDLMQTEAQESELGANGIIFLPYLLGERMPFLDTDVRGTFFGLERFHTRKDIIRSIFEAISFQAKLMIEEFEKNGYLLSFVNMSGGLAKIPLVSQIRADILGLPIKVLSEIETTAFGAFILTLKARGVINSITQASKMISVEKSYVPNMHNHNCYASLFILYKELYNEHKEMFRRRKDILSKISHYRKKVVENL